MADTPKTEKTDRHMFTPPSALSMSSAIHGRSLSGSLKSEIEEKQKLEKENFDLKMKIYYLEDNLRQTAEGTASNEIDELRSENSSFRLRLEEKEIDLEQRNHLLIKAKGAIESLKSELDKMKIQCNDKSTREKELQNHIRSLSEQGTGSDTEYQNEINSLHDTISKKNDELHHLHLDLTNCRSALADARESIARLEEERKENSERLRSQTNRANEIDEEVVQARTENDVLTIQIAEYTSTIESYRERFEEAMRGKESCDKNLADMSKRYEAQLAELRRSHSQEIENLRAVHTDAVSEMRESFRRELENVNSDHIEEIRELRSTELGSVSKVKEDLTQRIHEKSEEAISLRGVIELERSRVENLTQELHSSRRECEKWSQEAASWKNKCNESSTRLDEMSKALDAAQETVHAQKEELMLLRHDSQNEKGVKVSLQAELDKRRELIAGLEKELKVVKDDNERMKSLTEGVEGTSRDNERFKAALAMAQNDMSKLELKNDHLSSSNASLQSELSKRDVRIDDLVDELTRKSDRISGLCEEVDDLKLALNNEKSKCVALEAALAEHRAISHSLQSELDSVKEIKIMDERKFSEEGSRLVHARSDIGKTCSVVIHALLKWDKVLVLAMESFDIYDRDSDTRSVLGFGKVASSTRHTNPLSLLWNDGYQSSSNDTLSIVESMMDRPDELLQSSVAIVERIQVKLERLMKIRRLFETKSTQMVNEVQLKLKHAEDTVELLAHKIGTMQHLVRNTEDIILKEKRTRDESNQSMRSFQESVMNGHTKQIRELEEKSTSSALALQDSQHQVRRLEHEVAVLQEEISIMNEERERLADAEDVVAKLKSKFDEVVERNQQMSYEIDDRGAKIDELRDKLHDVEENNNRLSAAATALKHQIELRDKVLNEQETQLSALRVEINHLKQHQIDPKLEKSILESQDILRASLSNRHDASEYHRSIDDRSIMILQQISANIGEMLGSVSGLVRDTQSVVQDFEEHYQSSSFDMGTKYGLKASSILGQGEGALRQSVVDLLNANAKLALQVQQALTDLKKLASAGHLNASGSSGRYAMQEDMNGLNISHLTASRGLSMDMLSTSRHQETSKQHLSAERGGGLHTGSNDIEDKPPLSSRSRDRDSSFKSILRDEDNQSYRSGGREASTSLREYVTFSDGQEMPRREDTAFRSDNLPTSSNGYRPMSSSFGVSNSQRFSDRGTDVGDRIREQSYGHGESSRVTHQTNRTQYYQSQTRGSSGTSGGTYRITSSSPNLLSQGTPPAATKSSQQHKLLTQSSHMRDSPMGRSNVARESASRLSKLGTDLQSLAAKLDSFDVRHSSNHHREY